MHREENLKTEKERQEKSGTYGESPLPHEDVEKLVDLLQRSGVGEIRVRQGDLEVTVRAKLEGRQVSVRPEPSPLEEAPPVPETSPERNGELHAVRSPVVGTFYRAPSPDEPPYVEVGDHVNAGQTLCIIEAMKLMNEIPADISGEVVEVLVENAEGVEYDQPLFYLRPESR